MSSSFDLVAQPYAAAYAVVRRENTVAAVLRQNTSWMNGYYGLPSGKIEHGESATAATIREAAEEIGIVAVADALQLVHVQHRRDAATDMTWVDFFFEVDSWEGELRNAEPHLHSELAWLAPADLPDNVIPPVRVALEAIMAGRPYSEYGW